MKKPFVSLQQVQEIANTFPTPFYLYDEAGIRDTATAVNQAFNWNEGYREFFAVKALPNPRILEILHDKGCGCDCSSLPELYLAKACGFKGKEIMFSSNNTPDQEYLYAARIGATINLDDITHIDRLKHILAENNIPFPKRICCRYNPGGEFTINGEVMDNPGNAKYGMTKPQIFGAIAHLKALGVEEFGLHAFLASNMLDARYYPENAAVLFQLAVELYRELQCKVSFINLSGGIGIPYRPTEEPMKIDKIAEGVATNYRNLLENRGLHDVAIYTELGRYMTGPHGHLITKVIHEKHTHKEYIGVDANICDIMRPAMYKAYHHITVLGKEEEALTCSYDVVGSLCENNDKFAWDRRLPKVDIGDYLCIHDAGAHCRAMGNNYNGKLLCGEVLLRASGEAEVIRRRETMHDLFATLTGSSAMTYMHDHPEEFQLD